MTNATKFIENSTYQMAATDVVEPVASQGTGATIVEAPLKYTPIAGTVAIPYNDGDQQSEINGMMDEVTTDPTAGTFKLVTSVVDGRNVTKIQFLKDDVPTKVQVSYYYTETVQEANIDNRSSAMGEAIMQWPVYGNGDDCTDASIIGYVTVKVYRCRVTAQPGFDSSYKSVNGYQFTLAAINFLWLCFVKSIEKLF